MNKKKVNVVEQAQLQNVFVAIFQINTIINILVKNLTVPVKIALVNNINLYPQDQKNVGCIGYLVEKILMYINGELLASMQSQPRRAYAQLSFEICISCDGAWEDHEVLYETEMERQKAGKKIREQYKPLSTHQEIQHEVFINKNKSVDPALVRPRPKPGQVDRVPFLPYIRIKPAQREVQQDGTVKFTAPQSVISFKPQEDNMNNYKQNVIKSHDKLDYMDSNVQSNLQKGQVQKIGTGYKNINQKQVALQKNITKK
ncbi:hypothetical protein IMG5_202150 [Ichthyophthirius multifiliis]|uniref:Uncharacterized protein n=1 Tax=Ichthyophthirius multifiliis TaxID=5932 RepID=G0R632_ICHMU|nr:hypothetical protein IMG5_202150 [Ichthyophthirius multifiliis]EGR27098.1 hypothetical protein IMG5_202150 [Ichthyophthirius multifiliis]|eukprot:XP_004023982.1 hypothetical protein IMG5_202150 [Ichthyophthirius multifiliis]